MACILVTGGAGYIGSHTCLALLEAGHEVVVVDNFCNGSREALRRVEAISGRSLCAVHELDIRDTARLASVFEAHVIDVVVHFAALKAVGESVQLPLQYYDNNVGGTLALARVMGAHNVTRLVFSSSATVYGDPASVPISEDFPTSATNPYGWSKLMTEQVLRDLTVSDPAWRVVLLRYFNPVGAHESGQIGEDPLGTPNNLMPYVSQVAVGRRSCLQVFGSDYPTVDGSGVRDYIHVVDLAAGHVRAVERINALDRCECINLGTGRGYSVLEVVAAFERACGRPIPYERVARRSGDIAECWADPALAARLLDWRATRDLDTMCRDAWHWQRLNPRGFPRD